MIRDRADSTAPSVTGGSTSLLEKFRALGLQGAAYGVGSFLQRLAAVLLIPLYASVLTAAEYGSLGLIASTGQAATILFGLNMTSGMLRSYYDCAGEEERRVLVSTTLWTMILSGVVLLSVVLPLSPLLGRLVLDNRAYGVHFGLLAVNTSLTLVNGVALAAIRLRQEAGRFAVLQLVFVLAELGATIYLVSVRRWGVLGVLTGKVCVSAVSTGTLLYTTRGSIVRRISLSDGVQMLSYGLPLMAAGLSSFVFTYLNRYLIKHYLAMSDVGLYTLANQFGALMSVLLITPLKLVWGPVLLSVKGDDDFREFCSRVLTYVVLIGGFLFLGIALLSREAIRLMSAPEYWRAHAAVPVIAAAYLVWSTRSLIEVGVILERRTVVVTVCFVMGAAISVGANLVLIPRFGMMGAAYATLISFSAMIALDYVYSRRLYAVPYEWWRLARILAVVGLLYSVGAFWESDRVYVSLALNLGLIALYPLLLWLTGVFTNSELSVVRRLGRRVLVAWRCSATRSRG